MRSRYPPFSPGSKYVLIPQRNATYYLWHLRRRVWFRQYLPSLAHLQPVHRITSTVLQYRDLRLQDIDCIEYDQWRRQATSYRFLLQALVLVARSATLLAPPCVSSFKTHHLRQHPIQTQTRILADLDLVELFTVDVANTRP